MKASDFEFRHRGWVMGAIFLAAFGSYFFERVNAVEWLHEISEGRGGAARVFSEGATAHAIFGAGAALLAAAAWLRTWGTAYLQNEVVRDRALHAERLIAEGPFRYVRNPLYLGNILLAAGLAPMAPPIGAGVLVAGMTLFVLRLIGREEAFLLQQQGGAYLAYLERVPRLRPALQARVPGGGVQPRWVQAWAAEMWMWILAAASATFAITFNPGLFDYIAWGGLLFHSVVRLWLGRRARRRQT